MPQKLIMISRSDYESIPKNGYEIQTGSDTVLLVVEGTFYTEGQVDEIVQQRLAEAGIGPDFRVHAKRQKTAPSHPLSDLDTKVRDVIKTQGPQRMEVLAQLTGTTLGKVRGLMVSSAEFSRSYRKNRSGTWALK